MSTSLLLSLSYLINYRAVSWVQTHPPATIAIIRLREWLQNKLSEKTQLCKYFSFTVFIPEFEVIKRKRTTSTLRIAAILYLITLVSMPFYVIKNVTY